MTPTLLVLAGHDPTGGAGLIADAATARDLGFHPLTVPTTLTAQNSLRFVSAAPVDPAHIERTVALIAEEFVFDTAKVGLVPAADAAWLDAVGAILRARCRRIVIDPVLKATAGNETVRPNAAFLRFISGTGTAITPNRRELDLLADALGIAAGTVEERARALHAATGAAVVVTFEAARSILLVVERGASTELPITLVPVGRSVHGTGCRFSTALACGLAAGLALSEAAGRAADHLTALLGRRRHYHPDGQEYPG